MSIRLDALDTSPGERERDARWRMAIEFYDLADDSLAGAAVLDGGRPDFNHPAKVWTAGCMAMGEASRPFLVEFLRRIADGMEKGG